MAVQGNFFRNTSTVKFNLVPPNCKF